VVPVDTGHAAGTGSKLPPRDQKRWNRKRRCRCRMRRWFCAGNGS